MKLSTAIYDVAYGRRKSIKLGERWLVEGTDFDGHPTIKLTHFDTRMAICVYQANRWWLNTYSLGHGSISDQTGMNTLFRALNMPYRYDRDWRGGGPRITKLEV